MKYREVERKEELERRALAEMVVGHPLTDAEYGEYCDRQDASNRAGLQASRSGTGWWFAGSKG